MTNYFIYEDVPTALQGDKLFNFAIGDALIREVARKPDQTLLHFWPIENMIILGMVDTKLPYLAEAVNTLQEANYEVVVRPAGGLAVVADTGILNFSIILAESNEEKMTIDEGYAIMVDVIRQAFAPFGKQIEAYEIVDSYCPGKFDLSIDGKKFAGIAQRRFKNGIGIMIYLSVEGNQQKRGEIIRDFYQVGLKGEETRWHFPDVDPDCMANLSDLLGVSLTVPQVRDMILATYEKEKPVKTGYYNEEILADYTAANQKMIKRNEQIFSKE